jgi:hypothetical protein
MVPDYHKSPKRQALRLALACACLYLQQATAFEMEMGSVVLPDSSVIPAWTTVAFIQAFPSTPIVAALPTNQGTDPATIRIRNVTTTGFQIVQVEPNINDGPHAQMDTSYIAVEPGNHQLPDGSRLIAINHSTTSFANRFISTTWDTVGFPAAFPATPVIVAQIQTMANEAQTPPATSSFPFMDVGIRNVSTTSFQVTLERAESTAGTVNVNERIGIIAINNGVNLSFTDVLGTTIQMQSLLTARNIRGWDNGCYTNNYGAAFAATPLSVASANARFGNNGGWTRRCSESSTGIGLTVDEDTDVDTERNHITESAGVVAASQAYHANFGVDLLVSKLYSLLADPYNGVTNPKAIPDADVQYTIGVVNRASGSPDTGTLVVSEDIDPGLRLCVSATCLAGGPIVLDTSGSPVPPGVGLGTVRYSNDGGATYVYVPIPDADGFDTTVDAIEITMSGQLVGVAPAGAPSFELRLATRVN